MLRTAEVDVDDLVIEATARRRQSQPHRRARPIDVTARVVPMRILGDPDKLARTLRNLTDNAARHAVSRVAIDMTVDEQSSTGTIAVGDDGPGIDEADRERVMERFVRVDADRGRTRGGAGLGLAIVSEIVHAHRGEVTLGRSRLGGLEARIVVPLIDQAIIR